MKICAIICEYNPFHNGHLYQLNAARTLSKADAVVCVMSGNFTQRGEAAVCNKFIRAKHALLAGADIVLELPTVFATSNAELFAKGAVKILSSIPAVKTLCFGAETADSNSFYRAADLLLNEPKTVSKQIKTLSKSGVSYAKARAEAWKDVIPENLLSSPNNILGVEYTKALKYFNSKVDILPVLRTGSGYLDVELKANYSSASAIRAAISANANVQSNVPDYVLQDLPLSIENSLETLEKYALLSHTQQEIASVCDCTEGLENALKKIAETNAPIASLTSARYTASRIRRIALQNLLNVDEKLIRESLQSPLYLRVLAAKKERSDVLSAISESAYPIIARAHSENVLGETAKRCYEKDIFAEKIYSLLYPTPQTEKNIFI